MAAVGDARESDRRGAAAAAAAGAGSWVWGLRRVGREEAERLDLREGREVTLGRGLGVTHQLHPTISPLMISRNHCAFRLSSEGQCVVIDNQSLNGVWVNGKRIEPQQPYPLSEGDVIQLGVPLRDKERAEYEYRLTRCEEELAPTGEVLGTGSSTRNKAGERVKRKHNCEEIEPGDMERASCCKNKVQRVCDSHPPGTSASQEAWSSTEECVNPGTFREGWSSTEECVHSGTSQEARSSTADCVNPGTFREAWSSTEECVHSGSSSKREAFPQTSASGRLRKVGVQGDSAQALMVPSGKSWQIEDLSARVHGLENQQEEQRFQQLECQHQQQQLLKEPLYTQQQQQEVKVQKDEAAAHFTDVLENELQCIICSEHLIEAVTLNCSHSFCCHCILEWRKRKEECPICRQTIHSQTRSVVLDNCIERMLESLSEEVRERRIQLIKERKALKIISLIDTDSSSCADVASVQSSSTVGSSDIESLDIESSEMEEQSEEGETEENPIYYFI